MKTARITRNEQATRLVVLMIESGLVLKSFGTDGDYTVGPYTKAVGPSCFALFGYGRNVPEPYRAREGTTAEVARAFVNSVGSSRARETALCAPGRPPASDAAGQIARKKAEHIRSCRAFHCKECGN